MSLAGVETLAADVRGAEAWRAKARAGDPAALRAAAQQFEAMFLQIVLKTMRQTNFAGEDDPLNGGNGLKLYRELLDQQWTQRIATGRGLGFADAMYAAMSRRGVMPADAGAAQTAPGMDAAADAVKPATTSPVPPAAPATSATSGDGLAERKQAFLDELRPYAEDAARALGVPARFILAQAALETGWGQRRILDAEGRDSLNLFGVKAGGDWRGATVAQTTTEYRLGVAMKREETFRAYASYTETFQDYANLLARRYAKAASAGDSAVNFATALAEGGYATDPAYAAKLRRLIAQLA
jgi:flagellar protein FlgJ